MTYLVLRTDTIGGEFGFFEEAIESAKAVASTTGDSYIVVEIIAGVREEVVVTDLRDPVTEEDTESNLIFVKDDMGIYEMEDKPWYPDDGNWIEVVGFGKPSDIKDNCHYEWLFAYERNSMDYAGTSMWGRDLGEHLFSEDQPPGDLCVAYKEIY